MLLATLIVASSAFGTSILGVPTYYGNGVDSRLGAQLARDFLADQAAEATALSSADPSALNNRLTGNALIDVSQQISNQAASGSVPTVTLQPGSITIVRAQDPNDPSLVLEVQEDGTRSAVTSGGLNAAPTEQSVSFQGKYWMRQDSSGRYLIADQTIQNQPSSILPALAVVIAALVVVALTALLVLRQRAHPLALAPTSGIEVPSRPATPIPAPAESNPAASAPPPELLIRTFGGLHVLEGGHDWAQDLLSRPVTGFVWLRLLVAAIQDPVPRLGRDEVARQASPRYSREVQLKRLRNVVSKGLRELRPALRERIVVEPEAMAFRLDGCKVDAVELLATSREFENRGQLTPAQLDRTEGVIRDCQGAFLPEFDAIEQIATDRHPTCTELVTELRQFLVTKRVHLSLLVADTHLRAGESKLAIPILESAHQDSPARKDIADLLASAYRAAGRGAEASALSARYE